MQLEGVYSVLPTPFTASGEIDEGSLRKVIDLFIEAGVNGVTALGVTGEVARLDDAERRRVLEVVVQHVDGRIGVVAGTTAEGTRTCIALQPACEDGGRDRGDGEPAAHAEAELRGGRPPLRGAGGSGGHRDRGAGLSADLRLCDGTGAARADREGDPECAHDQARGPADAVQDLANPGRHAATRRCGSSAASAACSCSRSCWPAPPAP